jgi:hypothetical protein
MIDLILVIINYNGKVNKFNKLVIKISVSTCKKRPCSGCRTSIPLFDYLPTGFKSGLMSWMASPRDPMMGSIDILEKIRMMIVSI